VIKDITERKEAEKVLEKIEKVRKKEIRHRSRVTCRESVPCWIFRLKSSVAEKQFLLRRF
jgi:hypothetical protein